MSHAPITNLLVVDDEEDILELISSLLGSSTSQVFSASTIERAEGVLATQSIDLIICDHFLGEVRGVDWLTKLRDRGNKSHYIIYTGSFDIQAMSFPELGDDCSTVIKTDLKGLEVAINAALGNRKFKNCS